MDPSPAAMRSGTKRLSMFHVPCKLRSTTARKPRSEISEGRAGNCPPALLMRKSSLVNEPITMSRNDSTLSVLRMSHTWEMQRTPSASMSPCVLAKLSASRAARATSAPNCAKPSAVARPMPRPPPVTRTVRPRKRPGAKVSAAVLGVLVIPTRVANYHRVYASGDL